MKEREIISILKAHYIPYRIENGQIYADTMECGTEVFENVVNVTNWSRKRLFDWLGY